MSYEDGGMPAGGNSRFRGYPARMSERQQLALLLQMTSQEVTSGPSNRSDNIPVSNTRSSPLQHQKGSKSRWSNKNADILDVNTSYNRQDDRLRLVNGCDTKERNGSNSPEAEEVRTASGAESPVAAGSPAECAATVVVGEQEQPRSEQPPAAATAAAAAAARSSQQHEEPTYEMRRTPPQNKVDRQASAAGQQQQQQQQQQSQQQQQQSSTSSSGTSAAGSGGGSGGGRVTLRLNQVRATRDEKKGAGAAAQTGSNSNAPAAQTNASARQANASAASLSSSQMESSTGKSSSGNASATTANASSSSGPIASAIGVGGCCPGSAVIHISSSSSSADGGDVYEFKSSKEATPVRGSSSSPNPNPNDKDAKESAASSSMSSTAAGAQNQAGSGANAGGGANANSGSAGAVGSSTSNSSASATSTSGGATVGSSTSSSTGASGGSGASTEALASSVMSATADEPAMTTASPSSSTSATSSISTKRAFESEAGQADEQDEEGRKRKKKDTEPGKEATGVKGAAGRGQAAGRNNAGAAEKCSKSGKQAAGAMSSKGGQGSPSSTLNANSPKPASSSSGSGTNNPKGSTPSAESDGEDERSKNSDCNSAPKVPPLKIVIPQSTTSEQEQGNRNGKNTSNRSHQLPYVVASSNSSSDSMDKEQSTSAVTSGTTSPLDGAGGAASKSDEKKDFSGALDNESRSTHHQRVLRSSHRSGNGGNGNAGPRDSSTGATGNGGYSTSSPLPSNAVDRSNNSSPQQRHHSPTPESSGASEAGKSTSTDPPMQSSPAMKAGSATDKCEKGVEIKKETVDSSDSNAKKDSGNDVPSTSSQASVDLHPRKRKMKPSKEAQQYVATASTSETTETTSSGQEVHPHERPITNCFQEFLNLRKQIDRKRKSLFPVQPKPPEGFEDYLMNRCTYMLAGNANKEPTINPPGNLPASMKDLYIEQEKERHQLRTQHIVEKEKLVLAVEMEILRVHGRAARALANQSLPFSACTFLKDEEVYNVITPEQEEKDRNARSRYNGRLFISWLQDVDDKWEKIKEAMLLRHHNEAESLHAVQRLNWGFKLIEIGICETKATPQIEELHVPIVHVSDDFDLLPT